MAPRTGLRLAILVAAASGCATSTPPLGADSGTFDSATQGDTGSGQDSGVIDSSAGDTGGADSTGTQDADAAPPVDSGGPLYDFGCGGPMACQLSDVCCASTGSMVTFACVAQASCPAADKISCDGPDECVGTNTPICCGVETTNGSGNYPQCNPATLGTSCTTAANCPTHLGTSCTDTTTVVLCHVMSDCAGDPTNNQCCTFTSGGASLTFCIDSVTAGLGGAQCH